MRFAFAVFLALLLPLTAAAAPATYSATDTGVKGVCASTSCDAPVAAAGLTDGLQLAGTFSWIKGVVVTVCADSGQTLSGAGTVSAYLRDPSVALWADFRDLNFQVQASGQRCQSFPGVSLAYAAGRVTWVPTGVTVSSGGVTVFISGG